LARDKNWDFYDPAPVGRDYTFLLSYKTSLQRTGQVLRPEVDELQGEPVQDVGRCLVEALAFPGHDAG